MTAKNQPSATASDSELLHRVKLFLHQHGYGPHKALELSVAQGVVTIQGRVPTYYLRQVAVECLRRVAGVIQVVDRIEVTATPRPRQSNDDSLEEEQPTAVSTQQCLELSNTAFLPQERPAHKTPDANLCNSHLHTLVKG
jgi:osmotically-inducible protein OsmY